MSRECHTDQLAYDHRVTDDRALIQLIRTIGSGHREVAMRQLAATPDLAVTSLSKRSSKAPSNEFFLDTVSVQIYAGHTALHVAARAYDTTIARALLEAGANVRARNRRGAEPLHAATDGGPGSTRWDPLAQAATITYLVNAGADPEAAAEGGVTPLQRAVRNRCSTAVRALLDAGADPHRTNHNGSTSFTLAQWTTGRGGTGSEAAKREQAAIVQMLEAAAAG
jgi:ankyrin repeat protein